LAIVAANAAVGLCLPFRRTSKTICFAFLLLKEKQSFHSPAASGSLSIARHFGERRAFNRKLVIQIDPDCLS
jgi:hypothetical protein